MKHFSLKRKLSHLLLTVTCLAATVFISNDAKAQSFNFAAPTDGAGTSGTESGRSICTDAAGNTYVVGVFNNSGVGNTDFNLGAGVNNASTSSSNDGYIASYDKNGNYLWHTIIAGTGNEFSAPSGGICTNGTFVWAVGSTTVSGTPQTISSTATLSIVENSTPASSGSFTQAFVTKLNCANGSVSWTATYGGPTSNNDNAQGVCCDPNGCCYVIGAYSGSFTMNSVTAPAISGTSDLYVAKFGVGGNMLRIMTGGTTGAEMLGAGGGMCYVPGATPAIVAVGSISAGGNATFGSQTVANTTTSSNDGLLLEMDTILGVSIAHVIGSAVAGQAEELLSAVYDPFSGGVYVAGYYGGSGVTFPGTSPALNNAGAQDGAIARYSTSANTFTWSRSISSTAGDRAWGIAADGQGGVLLSGNYSAAPLAISGSAVNIATHAGGIGDDIFVVRFNPNGAAIWALRAGGAGDDEARGIACYVETTPVFTQNVFTTGIFQETATFGSTTLTADGTGNNDFFLARINDLSLPLQATQSQVNLTCNGVCTGSGTVVATGGIAPYTYSWSPAGGSGATASSLCATNYTVTITDAVSTSITKTFSITQPPAIVINTISQTNVSCFGGSNGAAQVTATGGTGTLVYNWTPGNPAGDGTGSVTGLTAQVYTVTVTDANSCTATRTFNITSPSALATTGAQTNVSCFGGSNATATVTVTGGQPTYSYNWTPGNPPGDGTATVTGLTAQVYTVTITDANACQTTRTFNITQPSAPVSGTTVVTNVSCFGGSNGNINLTPTGGTGPYTFNWLPSGPTTEDRTGLAAGTYSVQVTDVNGCTGTVTATVTQPATPVSGTTAPTSVSCFGGSNGTINLTPAGGTSPYTFNWLPSGPTTEDRTGLTAGTYTVQITDANGCTGTVTTTVTQPITPVSGTTVVTSVSCFGGNNGTINLTPTGGTSPYTFNWLPSGPTTEDRTGLAAGTYSVQITDVNGCTGTVTATVTQPATPVSGTTVVTSVSCFGGSNGTINLTPTGGAGPYTFNWLPSGPTTEDRTGLAAGTYSVQVTDVNGCTGTVTATVTQPTSPVSGTTVVTSVSCFGGSNGTINLTPTGGTGPYTFNWLPSGPTTEDRTGLVAGTYSVQVTDVNGCTGTVTATVTQPTSPVSGTTVVTNVACFGGSNGAINLTPTGGTGPYTFNWLPSGPTTEDRTGLTAGTYSVQITDVNGCTGTVTATVTQPTSPVSGTTVVTNVACFGGSNGAINLTPTGGTSPYTFNWLPSGPTTEDRTGLVAGTYSVQITDINGCTGTVTATVTQPTTPVSGTTVVTNVSCFGGSNGAINLTPTGGTGPYTFNWLPSGPTTEDRTGLTAGTYSVQITDVNGCTGTVTATVTQPATPVSGTTVVTSVSCFGGSNGTINLTPTGGTGPYTFNWLPSGPTTEDRTGLAAGTYSVQITDVNGCTGTVTATVTQPTSPVSGTTIVTNVSCFGGSNGSINLTPTGGTGPYTFNWLPSGPTTEDRTGLIAGTYSVQITDVNGCIGTVTATVTQPTSPVSGTTVVTNVSCFGGSNGSINLTPTGGTGPYTFNWLPSGPTTEDRTGLAAGTYSVQITDVNGCTGTVTATVTQPTSPVSGTTVVTNVSCFGGSNGTINLTPTGGTGPYTFNWLPSGPTTEDRTGLTAGTYSVQITDANGCTGTVTATVTQPTTPVSGTTVVTSVSCFGGSNGTINLTPSGGTGPYTFNWLPSGPTTEDRTGLPAGTYSVQITDVNGCTGTVTATVTQPTSPVSGTTVVTNVSCFGGSNGAINLTPTGGTGPYTFNWLPSGPTTEDRTGLIAGTYSVQITDINGCTGTVTATVTQPTSPVSGTTVVTNVSCFGGSNGAINLTPTGGTSPYTFNWLPSGPTTEDRTGLIAGTYSVQITDVNGCTSTVTATVTQPTSPVSGTTVVTSVSCFGGSNGTINLTPSGGTGPYTFNWLPSGPTTEDRTGLAAGTYSVQITDVNGCTTTVTATVTQPASPVSGTTIVTNVSCFGGSNGAINLTPTGGTGPYTFNWLPSGPTTEDRTGLIAGTYSVQITDATGCTGTVTAIVTQPSAPVSGTTVVTNVSCFGGSNGAINLTPTGGTGPYTFNWLPSGPTTEDRTGLTAGTYSVQITDANGCTGTVTATVTQPTSPVSGTTVITNVACFGGSTGAINLTPTGGTGPYTFNWLPSGPTTEDRTGLVAGTYSVQITDANGCTGTVTATVTQPTSPVSGTTVVTNVACFGGNTGAINLTPTGGTGPYTFNWLPSGPTTEDRTGLTAGTYSVQITDANGCTATVTATVTQPPVLSATVTATSVTCFSLCNGSATVSVSGGTPGYTYSWSPSGGNAATATGLCPGTYTVTITDANGCTLTRTVNIVQPPQLIVTNASQTNVSCHGGSNGAASVIATGGTGAYTYLWTPTGGTAASTTGRPVGTYTCTVTDINGCTGSATFNITEPPTLTFTTMQTNVSCNGGNNGDAMIMVSGGTPSYTYVWSPNVGNTDMVTGLSAGSYTCIITDANGCSVTATINITEPTPITYSTMQTNVSCNAGSDGTATVTASGGTGALTYAWAPTGGTAATATGLTSGNYTVTITDANSCTASATFLITQPTPITFTSTQTNVTCNGACNGSATVIVSGGTPAYTYMWLPSGGNLATANGLCAGTYTLQVTDMNGCTAVVTVTITEPAPIVITSTTTNVSCFGSCNGSATVVVSGGTPGYNYSWAPTGGNSATATGLCAGTYTITVTDANGCTSTQTVAITEPAVLTASMMQNDPTCVGANTGDAMVMPTGGVGPYTYLWAPSGGTGAMESNLSAGNYTVTITDANLCTFTATFLLVDPAAITFTQSQTNVSCFGGNNGDATVTATGGTGTLTYLWAPSGGTGAMESNLAAGNYTVTITDANLCTTTATFLITEPSALTAIVDSTTNPSVCGAMDGAIYITVTGGTTAYTYVWDNGPVIEDNTGIGAGAYNVIVTDANGCTTTASASINDPGAPTVTLSLPVDTACGDFPGTITLTGESPAGGIFSGTAVTGNTFDPFAAGMGMHYITYTFTDINGCTGSTTDSIFVTTCSGIQTIGTTAQWNLFPNPTNGLLTIASPQNVNGNVLIDVLGTDGKLIMSETKSNSKNMTIDLSTMPVGVYFIRITGNENVSVYRIVKM